MHPAERSLLTHPAHVSEIPDRASRNENSFGNEPGSLQVEVAPVPAEPPARARHSMARNRSVRTVPHDVADGARRPRPSGRRRNITVCGHSSGRNAPDHRNNARGELGLLHSAISEPGSEDHSQPTTRVQSAGFDFHRLATCRRDVLRAVRVANQHAEAEVLA
jgi:hypothetical protein